MSLAFPARLLQDATCIIIRGHHTRFDVIYRKPQLPQPFLLIHPSHFTAVLRMLSHHVSRRIPTGTKTSIRCLRAFAGRRKRATRVEIVNQELCGESTLLSFRSTADEGDKILRWIDFDPPFLLQTLATSLTLTREEVFGLKKSTTYYNLDAMSLLNPTSATIRPTLLPFCRKRIRYIDTLPFLKMPSTLAINYCPIIRLPSIHSDLIRPCY